MRPSTLTPRPPAPTRRLLLLRGLLCEMCRPRLRFPLRLALHVPRLDLGQLLFQRRRVRGNVLCLSMFPFSRALTTLPC